jgi:hypothetical protein
MRWRAGRHNSSARSLEKHGRLKPAGMAGALWHAALEPYPRPE